MARSRPAGRAGGGLLPWLAGAFVLVLIDQFTKLLVVNAFTEGQVRVVTSYFNLARHHNPGAAFSMLADASGWQRWFFSGLAAVAVAVIVWLLARHGGQRLFAWALTLILGGAVGNLIDRLLHGYVVDFLQFHWDFLRPIWAGGAFPTFNVADSAISLGVALLILDELRRVRRG